MLFYSAYTENCFLSITTTKFSREREVNLSTCDSCKAGICVSVTKLGTREKEQEGIYLVIMTLKKGCVTCKISWLIPWASQTHLLG